jgi:hypothetical protein
MAQAGAPLAGILQVKKPKDELVDKLERAITGILSNPKSSKKDKIDAIANGIKLLQVQKRFNPDQGEEFFGGTDTK